MEAATADGEDAELWQRYRGGSDDARDRLFLRHVGWARAIASQVHGRIRAYPVDRQDFIQNATIGLLDAMSRFNPERGVTFRVYAKPRVRGAVFNGLRAILGDRPPPRDEATLRERLQSLQDNGGQDTLESIVDSVVGLGLGFLLDEAGRHGGASDNRDGLAYVDRQQTEHRLSAALNNLPERLKLIIQTHYFHYVPFQDIAQSLGLTKGRVSQLHHAALTKLRESLRDMQ
jgi:RNA polymerase sigma factor for flagellar operon FliA